MFFFSSRRRHTRWPRDWSSDVCSSDLVPTFDVLMLGVGPDTHVASLFPELPAVRETERTVVRSEERRVGKERRSGWWRASCKRDERLFVCGSHSKGVYSPSEPWVRCQR